MPGKNGKYSVLALDGGGIRGLLSAKTLYFIEEYTGRPIYTLFDYVCGTSTGGLMALALTKPQPLTAKECVELYLQRGEQIFHRSHWRAAYTLNGWLRSKYDGRGLADVLHDTYGDDLLGEAVIPTMVSSYNLNTRRPQLHASYNASRLHTLVEVGLATSAAPTYFPPARMWGELHVDGGTVVNNPALSGVIELCRMHSLHTRDCYVLSLGTGLCESAVQYDRAAAFGRVGWVSPLIEIMLDGVPDLTGAQMANLLLDDQYLRLEPHITRKNAALDNTAAQNLSDLEVIAEKLLDLQKASLIGFLERL